MREIKEEPQYGVIVENLSNINFRIKMENGVEIIGYQGGKMRKNKIHMIVGDRVLVVVDPYGGKATNRIIRRM
jgi:translation initiation factor IF-1